MNTEDAPTIAPRVKPTAVKHADKTSYIVLRLNGATWQPDGPHQKAASATAAIRQAVALRGENDVDQEGEYVAIPLRSWQPVSVQVQTQTVVKLGEAT